jgi:hypothetical protein
MGKRIIITEEERTRIRGMYNLDEGWGKNLLDKLKQKGLDTWKKIFKKVTGMDVEDVTIEDIENLSSKQKDELENEVESNHSIKVGDVVTILKGDNQTMSEKVVYVDGNTITLESGIEYPSQNLRLEPTGTRPSHGGDPCEGAADRYLCYREEEAKGFVFPKTSSTYREFGDGRWKGVYKDF